MPEVDVSVVVGAPADRVWSLVRNFNSLADWHPAIAESVIEDGRPADQVGCVRRLTLGGGPVIRERLLALSDVDRSYTYNFEEQSAFPVTGYRATLRVSPATRDDACLVAWSGRFDCDPAQAEDMRAAFANAVYGDGLAALQGRFG